ncbi:hypothetical protein BB561_003875 [Smittium simulii]|uniref:Uncharacterized protein n=1 Tax=Smittium simulii TaxID=133385 RepID=A0A2T9YJ71_9FUNG|nr:hypothetical protein BB561_003875 [Smittium simulii]
MNNTDNPQLGGEGVELTEKITMRLSEMLVEFSESLQSQQLGTEENVIEESQHSKQSIEQKEAEISNLFLQLRKINREYGLAIQNLKQNNYEEIKESDVIYNKLQNDRGALLNIQQKIDLIKTQKSIYQDIALVSEEEFKETAPETLKENIETPHLLKLGQLKYEKLLRETLKTEKEELVQQRDNLLAKKRIREEYLQRLQNQINTYVKSADILRDALGIKHNSLI